MNMLKTTMLLAALTALFMALGFTIGGRSGAMMALLVAAGMNLFTFWNADKIVLKMHNAREVDASSGGDLYAMVSRLAQRGELPMPKVYLIETDSPNAFATGRNPENAAVAATTGLLNMLTPDEVEGVMAHELAHVKNRDTLIMTMVATIAGAISMIANFGLFFRDRNSGMAGLAAVFLAPFAAMIVQMAISRTREYGADKGGAEISGKPLALASALQKIAGPAAQRPTEAVQRNPATAQLYIVPSGVRAMFSTHPATETRIARLQEIAGDMSGSSAPSAAQLSRQMYGDSRPPLSRAKSGRSALDPLGRE